MDYPPPPSFETPQAALDRAKLHPYILELACTDGGAAGTALSVVPRYVRAISAPYQWQTVRLPKRIRALTPTQPTTSADSVKGKGKTVGRGGQGSCTRM